MKLLRKHFASIDSTNTWGKRHAHELPQDKITLVTADTQTAGRGRFKRQWQSPQNQNIYATFCFFVDTPAPYLGNIPQVLALSAVATLEHFHFKPSLKWPNDILLSGKKVAGILAETTMEEKLCIVLGIGLNVNMPEELLRQIDLPATSLMVESGKVFEIERVLERLTGEFMENLQILLNEGFTPFLERYRNYMMPPGTPLRFHDNLKIWEGKLDRINSDGSLSLELKDGETKTFIVGEILWPKN